MERQDFKCLCFAYFEFDSHSCINMNHESSLSLIRHYFKFLALNPRGSFFYLHLFFVGCLFAFFLSSNHFVGFLFLEKTILSVRITGRAG